MTKSIISYFNSCCLVQDQCQCLTKLGTIQAQLTTVATSFQLIQANTLHHTHTHVRARGHILHESAGNSTKVFKNKLTTGNC